MKKFFKTFLLLSLCLTATQGLTAQILYKVEGKDLKNPSYIFGSHHMAPISVISDTGADKYMEEAEQMVGEIDLTMDPMALTMAVQAHMMAPSDSTLSKVIAPEDMTIINEEFKKWSPMPGMDLSMLEMLKPMAVSTMVTVSMMTQLMPDFDPSQQLDSYVLSQGKEAGKKIVALETPEFQGAVLYDSTPISVQAEALVELLKNPEKAVENAVKLNYAYSKRDLDAMMEISESEDEHPEFMKALLDNRNADWLTKLPSIMEEGPSFIVVGALHLAGPGGIIEGLRNLGYQVTPVE